ncbi:MAG: tRNA (N6-isopentenyl adenosine(37)-C2)-methylthiotransferase MiaB [Verrucomicrobiaceae bacterium]|nr:tRNA (N6-isopentenyl adenosine(37)-C2)-methylthiotransferase MiaB [Verrucomicrobiaceae bacterium]
MKAYIRTYGCQMNERDSENIAANFVEKGWTITSVEDEADVIVINTCSVREQAEQKAIGKLSHLLSYRKWQKRNLPIIGVTGCMAQNRGEEIAKALPRIDFIAGPRKTHLVANIAIDIHNKVLQETFSPRERLRKPYIDISDDNTSHLRINKHYNLSKTSNVCAFVSIMQGCQMNCSYCIVPKVRGVMRSRPTDDVVCEVKQLVENGAKEVMLLGQVANAFGREIPAQNGVSEFVRLLQKLNDIDGLERIRFTSPHPSYFRDDLINAYGSLEKLCEYVHLPLQSGSDRILKAMNRPYKSADFLKIVDKLRARSSDMSISTDIIVGYPDETEEDFLQTVEAFKQANFDMAFIFKYSERKGTKSAELNDNISDAIKEDRNQRLLAVLEKQSMDFHNAMIGKTYQVLVESNAKRGENMFMGRTRNHRKCIFKADESYIGKMVNVKVNSATVTALDCEIV